MRKRRAVFVGVVLVSLLASSQSRAASADFSGTWAGTLSKQLQCTGGGTATATYATNGTFTQNADNVSATLTLVGPNDSCIAGSPSATITLTLSGTASGSTLTGTATAVDEKGVNTTGTFTGGLTGASMNLAFNGTNQAGRSLSVTGTLNRTSSTLAINSFTATPASISGGASSTLTWSVSAATSVSIDNGIGRVAPNGTLTVSPVRTTTYMLTASTGSQTVTATATVTVAPGPRVSAGSLPAGMVEQENTPGASDRFTLVNSGDADANVTLTASGGFFTFAPGSAVVPQGGTLDVNIVAAAKPAGVYNGTVTVAVNGGTSITVPVRLLAATPPTLEVNPKPAAPRYEVAADPGQNPSGNAVFVNTGGGVVQAIAVSDVPWLIPPSGLITVPGSLQTNVPFTIDRSKRNDDALTGGATGRLSLVFLSGPGSSANRARTSGTTSTSRVSVSIVDIVKPNVTNGSAPALASGELALFLPGCGTASPVECDFFVSPKTTVPVNDLKLFLVSSAEQATFPPIDANRAVAVPAATKSVFGVDGGSSLMLRSANAASLSVSAIRQSSLSNNPSLAYLSSFPVFRSDTGIAGGEKLTLSGVEQTATTATTIFVQELSGKAATVELQGYNAAGAPVGNAVPLSLSPFQGRSDGATTVTAGTTSVVVRNTSSGSGRINAYARVQDFGTSDIWTVTDPKTRYATTSTTLYMPLAKTPLPADVRIFTTNGSSAPVSVRIDTILPAQHRHAVTHGTASVRPEATTSIGPLQTNVSTIGSDGSFVRITSDAGVISSSARLTMRLPGGNGFGTALPIIPESAAIGPSQSKRFVGADDTATSHLALVLIETSGAETDVRVTFRFALNGERTVSQVSASQTYTVPPGEDLVLTDLGAAIIGAQRASYGDLRNVQIDVDVLSGGRILPFLESVDTSTNDVTMRTAD